MIFFYNLLLFDSLLSLLISGMGYISIIYALFTYKNSEDWYTTFITTISTSLIFSALGVGFFTWAHYLTRILS